MMICGICSAPDRLLQLSLMLTGSVQRQKKDFSVWDSCCKGPWRSTVVPTKATGEGMSCKQAAAILCDLLQVSAITSIAPCASSSNPSSLIDWNKGRSLCFFLYSEFCAGLCSLPFFFHSFGTEQTLKTFW